MNLPQELRRFRERLVSEVAGSTHQAESEAAWARGVMYRSVSDGWNGALHAATFAAAQERADRARTVLAVFDATFGEVLSAKEP